MVRNTPTDAEKIPDKITVEEDAPFDTEENGTSEAAYEDIDDSLKTASKHKLERDENQIKLFERLFRIVMRRSGLRMIAVCLGILIGLYIFDVILINKGLQNSEMFNPLFELLKLIVTTLIGYVFAVSTKED